MLIVPRRGVGNADPYFSNVSLLLHGDGANGSTSIVDSSSSPKTVTAFGNAQISTAQGKFGGASIAFDGSGDYLGTNTSANNMGTAPWTAECFFRYSGSNASYPALWGNNPGNYINPIATVVHVDHAAAIDKVTIWAYNHSANSPIITSATIAYNVWHYLAIARNGTTLTMALNGAVTTATISASLAFNFTTLNIGGGNWNGINGDFTGFVDEFRVTPGISRDVTVVPTAPFPDA